MASMEETPVQAPAMTFDPRARAIAALRGVVHSRPDEGLADELQKWVDADESGGRKLVDSFLLDRIMAALRQSNAGKDSISEFEQIVKDESAQWKGVGDDTHGAQTACQMILQKIAALKERT